MLDVAKLEQMIQEYLQGSDYQLTTLTISPENEILVEVDRLAGVDLDFCAGLNDYLNKQFDREKEDYSLEVGSVCLTDPFKTKLQYEKNLGHPVELLTNEGKKLHGELVSVDEDTFMVDVPVKKKETQSLTLEYGDIKYIRYDLKI
ncbi:MAG: ribosome assembly cofactor RimP [Paludibacteraceae bacterium]|nr:ribosome assembly cofactor RimP [Paludibacteraceae bacterium]